MNVLALLALLTGGFSSGAVAQLAGGGVTESGPVGAGASLRDTVSALQNPLSRVSTGLPWTFSGDVDVEVGVTDSPGGTSSHLQPLLLVSPDFNLNGVTSRLNVALSYSPRLAYYPSTSNQTLLSHTFNGTATATIVPDWLYLNVRGITGITSRFGYSSLQSNTFYSQDDAVQTSSFSVTPYLQRTIDGWGTVTAGYTYARTFQDSPGNIPPGFVAPNASNTAGFGTTGDLATNTEYASFVTGENLGRIQDSASVSASQNGGSAFYQGSSTFAANNTVSYAVYRWLSLLASVGYEEYDYPSSHYSLSEPSWSVGVTVTPNAESSITVRYGKTAGVSTVLASGTFAPTPRTRLYGSYDVEIETGLGAQQGLLGTTTVGPGGLLVSSTTGVPVSPNNYLASQYPLSRVKTLTLGGSALFDRDTVSASVSYTKSTQLVSSTDVLGITTGQGTQTDSTYGTVSWQHDLNPSNSLFSSASYGTSNNGAYFGFPGSSQDTWQLYSGLNHIFTETLSGSVSYSHSERSGGAIRNLPSSFGGAASQNTLLVGLRKSF